MSETLEELRSERARHMDAEPAGELSARRQSEVIADLTRRINALVELEGHP